jgi:hypothetical protein
MNIVRYIIFFVLGLFLDTLLPSLPPEILESVWT